MTKVINIVRHTALIAISATALISVPALANTMTTRSVPVGFANVDLSTPAGQKTMHTRMTRAARLACGYDGSRDLTERTIQSRCIADAMNTATVKLAAVTDASANAPRVARNDLKTLAPRR